MLANQPSNYQRYDGAMTDNQPLFDSSRAALVFALNATKIEMPRPSMNKEMASIKLRPPVPKTKRERKLMSLDEEEVVRKSSLLTPPLRGIDKAAQAGFILQQFAKAEKDHRMILTGLLTRPRDPCTCNRPCCSGFRPVLRWVEAVRDTCDALACSADILKTPGKRGLSTQPVLRRLLVEQYFTKNSTTLFDLAIAGHVSPETVAQHRTWILGYLETLEHAAWLDTDSIFDSSGITGYLG